MTLNNPATSKLSIQFYSDGYNIAKQYLKKNNLSKDSFFQSINNFYQYLEKFISAFSELVLREGQNIDCHKGCCSCCRQAVFVSPFEALYLANYIKTNFSIEDQDVLKLKLLDKQTKAKKLNSKEYLDFYTTCPLLDKETGSCTIYSSRPVACRLFLSKNVQTCKSLYIDKNKYIYPALYDLPLQVGREFCTGFNRYLTDLGLSVNDLRLEDALLIALSEENITKMWLNNSIKF